MSYNQNTFNKKGFKIVLYSIIIFLVVQEICWLIKGDWMSAILFSVLILLIFVGIPYAVMQIVFLLGRLIDKDKNKSKDK